MRDVKLVLIAFLIAVPLQQTAVATTAFVEGEAFYRERILPPPGATLIVTVEDVSRADAKSIEIGSARLPVTSGPPYRWRIEYDPASTAAPRRIALRAQISTAEGLWMTTDTFVPLPDPPASAAPSLRLVRVTKPTTAVSRASPNDAPSTAECAAASTQALMTRCAYEDFLAANAVYAERYQALSSLLAKPQRDRFQRMQKKWIGYRTAACDFESGAAQGGSVQQQLRWSCMARMTRERAEALGRLANCPEGDVTCNRRAR